MNAVDETLLAAPTSFPALKRLAKDFLDALPTATPDERDAGWKCFSLAYLQFDGSEIDRHQAAILLTLICRQHIAAGGGD